MAPSIVVKSNGMFRSEEAVYEDGAIVRVYGAGTFLGIGRIDGAAATVTPEKVIAAPLSKQKPQSTGA